MCVCRRNKKDLPLGFSLVRKYDSIKLYKISNKNFLCEFAYKYSLLCTD